MFIYLYVFEDPYRMRATQDVRIRVCSANNCLPTMIRCQFEEQCESVISPLIMCFDLWPSGDWTTNSTVWKMWNQHECAASSSPNSTNTTSFDVTFRLRAATPIANWNWGEEEEKKNKNKRKRRNVPVEPIAEYIYRLHFTLIYCCFYSCLRFHRNVNDESNFCIPSHVRYIVAVSFWLATEPNIPCGGNLCRIYTSFLF